VNILVAAMMVAASCCIASPALAALLCGHPAVRRALGVAALMLYACAYFVFTFYGRAAGASASIDLRPFWSWRASLSLDGFVVRVERPDLLLEIVPNFLLYVPLGCLLPVALDAGGAPCRGGRGLGGPRGDSGACGDVRCAAGEVVLVSLALSVSTELAQALLRMGLCELDDVFGNVAGALVGYLSYR